MESSVHAICPEDIEGKRRNHPYPMSSACRHDSSVQRSNPLPLILNRPTAPNMKYSQNVIVYHMMEVFDIRGCRGGGLNSGGSGLAAGKQLGKLRLLVRVDVVSTGPVTILLRHQAVGAGPLSQRL